MVPSSSPVMTQPSPADKTLGHKFMNSIPAIQPYLLRGRGLVGILIWLMNVIDFVTCFESIGDSIEAN